MAQVNGMDRSIGRLEGKLDLVIQSVEQLKASFETLEAGRLSKLEKEFANLMGRMTIIAAGASIGVSLLISFVSRYF